MAQPVPRRQALEQGKDARGEVLRKQVAGGLQQGLYQVAQADYARRRGRFMNGYGEGRKDCARLFGRDGAGLQELQQGRPVEARDHNAEAPLHGHLVEHLRCREAGSEGGTSHFRLVPTEPLPLTGRLEQLHDLTGRPGVDVRRTAFADLLPQGSLHGPTYRLHLPRYSLRRRQIARGRRRLTKQVMLFCIGLVEQARSRPRQLLKNHTASSREGPLTAWPVTSWFSA